MGGGRNKSKRKRKCKRFNTPHTCLLNTYFVLVIILGAGCIESNKSYIHAGETDNEI